MKDLLDVGGTSLTKHEVEGKGLQRLDYKFDVICGRADNSLNDLVIIYNMRNTNTNLLLIRI